MLEHRADSSCSHGLYLAPKMGESIDSLQPLPISWDPSCLSSNNEIDIYLYAPNSPLPRIHVWQHIATTRASYSAQLMPRWWNATSTQQLQIIIVPTGNPPFTSTFAAGPVFNATYTAPSGQTPAAADTSQIDSGITLVNDVANANEKAASGKKAAAGILVPFFIILIAVAVYIKFKRNKQQAKRRAWTEKVDTRMSTISTDWKSISAAGAQAAIRNSMAANSNRASSFSFGVVRPLSVSEGGGSANNNDGMEGDQTDGRPKMRTGTGVGLRNPNTLSQAASTTTSDRFSRGVSRVSFADQPRPSTESRRANQQPSRPFHNAHVPPVPSLPAMDNREELSPKQTAGALSLTPEDIKARIAAAATGKGTKSGSVSGFDEVLPALSLMRTGNDPAHPDDDDFLFLPTPPEPSRAKPTAHKKSAGSTTTSPFSMPPNQPQATAAVLSPDEMLRAYAERKKSLAAAAAAGRIGAAPMRVSASASSLSNNNNHNNASSAASSLRSGGGSTTPVQTVGSIHDTGMRVAYHSDVARVSLKLGASSPTPPSPSRSSLALSSTTSKRKSSLFTNPFASSTTTTTSTPPLLSNSAATVREENEDEGHHNHQHAKPKSAAAYMRAERAVSLAKMVDDELARVEAEAAEAEANNSPQDAYDVYAYAFSAEDPAAAAAYAYDGGGGGGGAQDVLSEEGQDVGVAGRGAYGYRY